ncbi:MAG: hypothetical protein V4527_04515 [Pseudomonadota bacterium]
MRCLKAGTAALISLSLFGAAAQAATPLCTTSDEMAALRTAAVQQELMVAGLTCHAIDAYNRFVIAYRPELQKSDADLKAYFVRRDGARGEAEYDTFKTKLANLSSLSDIANSSGYCASTRAAFELAMRDRQSLASFVADQRLMIALPEQKLCMADPARPITASAESAAPLRFAAVAPIAVAGVPSHELPASPYGARVGTPSARFAPPPPPAPPAYRSPQSADSRDSDEEEDYDDDEDAAPIPPSLSRPERPAVIQAQRDQAYGAASWPPGWAPQPYSRWYRPYPYSYYGR